MKFIKRCNIYWHAIYLKPNAVYYQGVCCLPWSDPEGVGGSWSGPPPSPPLKNHKTKGFLSKTGPDPLKNYKATKPVFLVGPSSAHHLMVADDGPFIVIFRSSFPSSTKKSWTSSDKTFWIRAFICLDNNNIMGQKCNTVWAFLPVSSQAYR